MGVFRDPTSKLVSMLVNGGVFHADQTDKGNATLLFFLYRDAYIG